MKIMKNFNKIYLKIKYLHTFRNSKDSMITGENLVKLPNHTTKTNLQTLDSVTNISILNLLYFLPRRLK